MLGQGQQTTTIMLIAFLTTKELTIFYKRTLWKPSWIRGNSCKEFSSVEATYPLQNINSHGCVICPWLKESVTNMWINFFYMKPKFKEQHVAMKSCCPQAFLTYFVLMEFISFSSRNTKALKLFSITSYNGVHILCFKEP